MSLYLPYVIPVDQILLSSRDRILYMGKGTSFESRIYLHYYLLLEWLDHDIWQIFLQVIAILKVIEK